MDIRIQALNERGMASVRMIRELVFGLMAVGSWIFLVLELPPTESPARPAQGSQVELRESTTCGELAKIQTTPSVAECPEAQRRRDPTTPVDKGITHGP